MNEGETFGCHAVGSLGQGGYQTYQDHLRFKNLGLDHFEFFSGSQSPLEVANSFLYRHPAKCLNSLTLRFKNYLVINDALLSRLGIGVTFRTSRCVVSCTARFWAFIDDDTGIFATDSNPTRPLKN
jgi:hypothetical protein